MIESLIIARQPIPRHVLNNTLLQYLDKQDKESVSDVFYFVIDHYREANILRDNGYPGEVHIVNVAKVLDFDAHLMKLALLHDFLEDIPKNQQEFTKYKRIIKSMFGDEMLASVLQLTKKNNEDYPSYISRIKGKACIIVKEADMLDNIRTNYSLTLKKRKHNIPWKVDIFLKHLAKNTPETESLYDHAYYKYYAKIIEEIFRMHESHLKNMVDEHKFYLKDVQYLEKLLADYYERYSTTRKEVYKKFVLGLIEDKNAVKHLDIELRKRFKEALNSHLPLNSMLISIDQNLFLFKKASTINKKESYKLLDGIVQQIKYARLEAFRLQHKYEILTENKKLLGESFEESHVTLAKIKMVHEANKKLSTYAKLVESVE